MIQLMSRDSLWLSVTCWYSLLWASRALPLSFSSSCSWRRVSARLFSSSSLSLSSASNCWSSSSVYAGLVSRVWRDGRGTDVIRGICATIKMLRVCKGYSHSQTSSYWISWSCFCCTYSIPHLYLACKCTCYIYIFYHNRKAYGGAQFCWCLRCSLCDIPPLPEEMVQHYQIYIMVFMPVILSAPYYKNYKYSVSPPLIFSSH